MIGLQNTNIVSITPPAAIANNTSPATAEIDTKGFRWASIFVHLGATDIALTALKVTHSDTAGSGHADISGADFSVGSLLPTATDDNKFWVIHLDLRNKKRYLDLVATIGNGVAGAYLTAWAVLSDAEEAPNSATERGLANELFA